MFSFPKKIYGQEPLMVLLLVLCINNAITNTIMVGLLNK